jgi:hypothetical protein
MQTVMAPTIAPMMYCILFSFLESKNLSSGQGGNKDIVSDTAVSTFVVYGSVFKRQVFGKFLHLNHRSGEHLCPAAATLHEHCPFKEQRVTSTTSILTHH